AFVSNYFLAEFAGSSLSKFWLGYETWRWMFWVELVPAVIFLLALLAIPESPSFLVASGQKARAQDVLNKLYGTIDGDIKMREIDASLAADHHKPRLSDLIDKATNKIRPITWVAAGLAVLQLLVGINVVFYCGAVHWQAASYTQSHALLNNLVSASESIAACFITFFLIVR